MRRAARSDDNQAETVAALRAAGATVEPIHTVGRGVPDLLVGYRGRNYLIEVKNARRHACALTPDQVLWHRDWRGQVAVAATVADALEIIGATDHPGNRRHEHQHS